MESIEDIQARHRRELRDLQGRITNKKKNATKKTRKGVNDECAALEHSTRERHQAELFAATGGGSDNGGEGDHEADEAGDNDSSQPPRDGEDGSATQPRDDADVVTEKLAGASIGSSSAAQAPQQQQQQQQQHQQPKKRNRQKDRLARRQAELDEQTARAHEEASLMKDDKVIEEEKMKPVIAKSGRVEFAIRPDGHCLFSAVADQLERVGRSVTRVPGDAGLENYRVVRHAAARYMAEHPDDFEPFLAANEDGGDLDTYIEKIRDTARWGGQMELMALANEYDVRIQVLHDGRSDLVRPASDNSEDGADEDGQPGAQARPTLWLVYYRHGFGLGEHYNSLREKPAL
ncbi:OTU protein [Sporothrix bragantina]|uniref:OTU protein n=1 Tax=Sporothrix bragantina TaxID=671064 RepID=A0ABP0C3R4_9PEZI